MDREKGIVPVRFSREELKYDGFVEPGLDAVEGGAKIVLHGGLAFFARHFEDFRERFHIGLERRPRVYAFPDQLYVGKNLAGPG